MTDAPDRILVDASEAKYLCAKTFPDHPEDKPGIEYIRADLVDAAMEQAKMHHAQAFSAGADLAPQWQPIETAPKDGTAILACAEGFSGHSIVQCRSGEWLGFCDDEPSIQSQGDCYTDYHHPFVTHWMPLPQPPQQNSK